MVKQEIESVDVGAVESLVSQFLMYYSSVTLRPFGIKNLDDMMREQGAKLYEEFKDAGGIDLRSPEDTTLDASFHNFGAKEFTSNLPRAGVIRVYGTTETEIIMLPKLADGHLERFLETVCSEADSAGGMLVAIPAKDYLDGYILWDVWPGGCEKLTKGDPITSPLVFLQNREI